MPIKNIPIALLIFLPGLCSAMELVDARHLLARSGFGGTYIELQHFDGYSFEDAVDELLDGWNQQAITELPDWVDDPPPDFQKIRQMSQEEKKTFRKQRRQQAMELQDWWYREMIETDSPLTERMVLFWHNHFTSSFKKVKRPSLLYRQNQLFREHALGNFRDLLHAAAKDPAMILYLDNQTNRKGKPNENFTRELLELFTLGEGNYTERDIKEGARAFTGWMVNRKTGEYRFARRRHDDSYKEFMGRAGNLDGDEVIDIILQNQKVAHHITGKLWREFISETPDPDELERLAGIFHENDYEIKPLIRAIFLSPHFRDPRNRGVLIKSPVDLLVGTVRVLNLPLRKPRMISRLSRQLGQDIFNPPNVKGWPGGTAWISSSSLLLRQQILQRLARGKEMSGKRQKMQGDKMMNKAGFEGDLFVEMKTEHLIKMMLAVTPVNQVEPDPDIRAVVAQLLVDPAYQLK